MISQAYMMLRVGAYAGESAVVAATPLPGTVAGLMAWYFASPAYCFTDAAGTVPCGDGDPVRVWKDRSGNGWHVSQATLASRPIFYDLGGGLYIVMFDGTDDTMRVVAGSPIVSSNYSVWSAVANAAAASGNRIAIDVRNSGDGGQAVLGTSFTRNSGSPTTFMGFDRPDSGGLSQPSDGPYPGSSPWVGEIAKAAGSILAQITGSAATSSAADAGNSTVDIVQLGGNGYGGDFAAMDAYQFLLYMPKPSAPDRAAIRTYLETYIGA